MVEDARTLQARGKDMPFNYNVGNSKYSPCNNAFEMNRLTTTQSSKMHLQSRIISTGASS